MPVYTYKCEKCGAGFEEILPISERNKPTEAPCKECGVEGFVGKTILTTPAISSGVNVTNKVPHWMKDKMRQIKKDRATNGMDHLL